MARLRVDRLFWDGVWINDAWHEPDKNELALFPVDEGVEIIHLDISALSDEQWTNLTSLMDELILEAKAQVKHLKKQRKLIQKSRL